ncbi:flagellin [Epibacterium ulvae]|uniref:flagellin N-terminal helical domain-containing protein n=1 Tax=Epibacterium ulvae TaxID=1156985 RepID=UPI001BFC28CD|nr:flagellin [Epibacterium ulvae]MBT8155770.1 flagellin [Epibacterium ulvae]
MTSILTNSGAMVALQTLSSINNDLTDTQNAISTGREINTAKDNSAIWSISKVMEADAQSFEAVEDSLSLGAATVGVALAAVEQVSDILNDVREKIIQATGENVDRTAIGNEITQLTGQIEQIIDAAQFNGANLLDGTTVDGTETELTVLSSVNRSSTGIAISNITVPAQDFTTNLDLTDIDLTDAGTIDTSLQNIEAHLTTLTTSGAVIGAAASRIDTQMEFIGKVKDATKEGIGALVDTDMEEASARLKALQTQQQLGVQALSIANSSPSTLQQLFR